MTELPSGISMGAHGRYRRHRPELTLLYQLVEQHYPEFAVVMRTQDCELPTFVQREFDEYLRCGRLEHGFPRVRCNDCHAEKLDAFSWPLLRIPAPGPLGDLRSCKSAVLPICQRLGGALNLNIHYHMIFLDGIYFTQPGGAHRFVKTEAPTSGEMGALVQRIAKRVGRHPEWRGLLIRDAGNAYLKWDGEEASPLHDLAGRAMSYRVAVGPNRHSRRQAQVLKMSALQYSARGYLKYRETP